MKIGKLKKEIIMLTLEIKICHMKVKGKKKNIREINTIKENCAKSINCIKELENVSLNK